MASNRLHRSAESDDAARVHADIHRALECNRKDAQAAALKLVALLEATAPGEAIARGGLSPCDRRKVDAYLKEHLTRPLHVAEVAKNLALSVSHFHRAFKQSYGTTPRKHLIWLRLELAKELMSTTILPLSQIALACGLSDQAHLSKMFRRWLNDTPSAWRRRHGSYETSGIQRKETSWPTP